jgi:two-component system cell cycle sensor histidine kinase/response regulator CckA
VTTDGNVDSARRFGAFFDHCLDAVLVMDDAGRHVDANPAACALLGYTRDELCERSIADIVPEEDRARVISRWADLLRTGQREGRLTVCHRDGTLRHVEYRARARVLPGLHVSWNRDVTERGKAEEALRLSEKRFLTLLERSTDVISLHDLNGVMRYQSPSVLPLLGYDPEELVGQLLRDYIHPDDQARVAALIEGILRSPGGHRPFETRFLHKNGTWRWFECAGTNLLDDPTIHGLLFNARDITERKATESALQRTLVEREVILRTIADGIIVTDPVGRMLFANEAAARLMRFDTPAALVAATSEEIFDRILVHDEDDELVAPPALPGARVLRGEPQCHKTVRWRHRAGGPEQVLLLTAVAIRDGDEIRYAMNVLHDVTERTQHERAVNDLAGIVNAAEDAVIGATLDGVTRSWNPGAERLYGYSAEQAIGQGLTLLYGDGDTGALERLLAEVRAGRRVPPFDARHRHENGSVVEVSLTAAPVHDRKGRAVGVAIIAHDVRQRTLLERQFRQAQKMEAVGNLAGGIAHDFNNILTVITSNTEFLEEEAAEGSETLELVVEIRDAARRATELVRQLLAFSRKQVLEPRVLDLEACVHGAERMLRRLVGEDVTLVVADDSSNATTRADPSQIDQILVNLVINARDAMPQGGTITIQTAVVSAAPGGARAPSSYARLSVTDTGVGMNEETKARIFEPFFTTKGPGQGTGLGLAMAYGAVTQHGGFIEVASTSNRGTRFDVFLPWVGSEPEPAASVDGADAPKGDERVLVVEDDPAVRRLVRRALESCGYEVIDASTAEEASAHLTAGATPIDLLLTDVVLPGASGRELAERVATSHPGTKVLFMSGYTDDAVVRRGISRAEVAFLAKPFTALMLARKVRAVLDDVPRSGL